VSMTSYYDVTNSVYAITITILRHYSKLEFRRGRAVSIRPGRHKAPVHH